MKRLAQDYRGAWYLVPEERYDEFKIWANWKMSQKKEFEPPEWVQRVNLFELRLP